VLLRVLCALVAALVTVPPGALAQGGPGSPTVAAAGEIPMDPAVRRGVLPNGLRYAILHNDRPIGGVSIRMRIDVGSLEEASHQSGIAHFLEHMAFNGTDNFPEGELSRRFAAAGVAFGRDQNASTSAFATTYELDLPLADEARLDLAFAWLGDIADGLVFDPEAVDRERGVVMAEHDGGLGAARDRELAYQAFAAPEHLRWRRPPIGRRETIAAITADQLQAFHRAWYRPDNAVVVIVGDRPQDELEARIRATFSDWTASGPAPTRAVLTQTDFERSLDVAVRADPTLGSTLSACRLQPWARRGPDTVARRRENILRTLWTTAINRRFQRIAQIPNAPFSRASLGRSAWTGEADAYCLSLTPNAAEDWRGGLDAALTELRRLEAHGVTQGELDRAVAAQRAANAAAIASAEDRFSTALVNDLLAAQPLPPLDQGGFVHPRDIPAIYDPIAETITPAEVHTAFRQAWAGSGPLIWVSMPTPPDPDAVRVAWTNSASGPPPAAYADVASVAWAYSDFGDPGTVASRETVEPGFTRVTFDNGVVLNVKSVEFTRDLVQVGVRFGLGRREIADADLFVASIGQGLVPMGGLERHAFEEIRDLFPDKRLDARLTFGDRAFSLNGSTRTADLETQLQLMAALLSDPGFRPEATVLVPTALDAFYRNLRTQPSLMMGQAITEAIAPDSPLSLPPREVALAITIADLERVFRSAMTEAPLEVTLVGDVSEYEAIAQVAATFGALPRRLDADRGRADTWYLRYPDTVAPIVTTHEGPADQALVAVVWPLFVADSASRREQRALRLFSTVLREEIRSEVRETLGASYSPSTTISLPDQADQGSLTVSVATSPQQTEAVREAVRRVMDRLVADGGVTQIALDAARTPILDRVEADRRTNSWWFGVMNGSAAEPQVVDDALSWPDDYRAMTVAEVQAAAARWLSSPPFEAMVLPRATTPTQVEAMP
jgi:zinc protease